MPNTSTGTILEALNDKMDRDGHNTENPTDVVIEYQAPTSANGGAWYRKYKSGWVEQGGYLQFTSSAYATYSLIIPMANTNYSLLATWYDSTTSATSVYGVNTGGKTTTSFMAKMGTSGTNTYFQWEVKGVAAS